MYSLVTVTVERHLCKCHSSELEHSAGVCSTSGYRSLRNTPNARAHVAPGRARDVDQASTFSQCPCVVLALQRSIFRLQSTIYEVRRIAIEIFSKMICSTNLLRHLPPHFVRLCPFNASNLDVLGTACTGGVRRGADVRKSTCPWRYRRFSLADPSSGALRAT